MFLVHSSYIPLLLFHLYMISLSVIFFLPWKQIWYPSSLNCFIIVVCSKQSFFFLAVLWN
uniref:Uncharacterized protein n=1 Tax=Rhizophora mucronata TaxID=61149 RepID=A0A2P2NDU0_RHIMU